MGIGDFPAQFFGFCEEFCANFLIESKILSMEAANSFFCSTLQLLKKEMDSNFVKTIAKGQSLQWICVFWGVSIGPTSVCFLMKSQVLLDKSNMSPWGVGCPWPMKFEFSRP